jgi:preprotein translocase subunit SecF
MILLKASFTLPGIAGLILSVGMSVDANILIFERIREELARGTKMRMAIRNGFARATTTIIDANVTTLIAGLVLYAIGTDLIRGFAVTLNLGLLISMFTAVYCSHVIFEIGERRHWYRSLYMVQWVRETHFNFLGRRKAAIIASTVLILVGLVGAGARGVDLLDIDLAGGTAVDVLLSEPLTETQMREKLDHDEFLAAYHAVVTENRQSLNPSDADYASRTAEMDEELKLSDFDMTLLGLPGYTDDTGRPLATGQAWKVVTSLPSVQHLEAALQRIFGEGDGPRLIMHHMEIDSPPEAVAVDVSTEKEPARAPQGEAKMPAGTTTSTAKKATPGATPAGPG